MTHDDFKNKWENLIFAPLDLPVPPIELNKLIDWCDSNPNFERQHAEKLLGKKYSDEEWEVRNWGGGYTFWQSYFVKHVMTGWDQDFLTHFPEIQKWLDTLPIKEGKRFTFGFLRQYDTETLKEKKQFPNSTMHVDENASFGLRWFLNNNQNNLYFHPFSVDNKTAMDNYIDWPVTENGSVKITSQGLPYPNPKYFSSKTLRVNTRKNTAFLLGQVKAAHSIQHEITNDKFTFIVQPIGNIEHRWDWQKVDEILVKSIAKYPEEVIWHEDFYN